MEVKLLNKFIIILLVVLWIYLIINRSKFFLHMMQLEGYENNNYRKWILESDKAYSIRLKKSIKHLFIIMIIYLILVLLTNKGVQFRIFILHTFYIIWALYMFSTKITHEGAKKPLVFTRRATRLYITNLILNIVLLLIIFTLYIKNTDNRILFSPIILFIGSILYYFQSETIYLSNILVKPIEDTINRQYFEQAQER